MEAYTDTNKKPSDMETVKESFDRLLKEIITLREKNRTLEAQIQEMKLAANNAVDEAFNKTQPDCGRNAAPNWR